jgi:hypothetical protein
LLVTLALEHWLAAQPKTHFVPRRGQYRNHVTAERWAKWVAEAGLERMQKAESVND